MSETTLRDGTAAFFRAPQSFLLAQAIEQGDVAHFRLGGAEFCLVSAPELVRRVFLGGGPTLTKSWLYDVPRAAFGDGLVTVEQGDWRAQRELHAPHFLRLAPEDVTAAALAARRPRWEAAASCGVPVDPFREARAIASEIVLGALFGIAPSPLTERLFNAMDEVGLAEHVTLDRMLTRLKTAPSLLGMFRASERDAALQRLKDLADELLASQPPHAWENGGLLASARAAAMLRNAPPDAIRRVMRDLLLTNLMAGSLSTGDAVGWALCLLARDETVSEALADEVGSGRPASPGTLLSCVIEETLRLYPPIWFIGRLAAAPLSLGDAWVQAGTAILCSPYVLHRLPRLWEAPDRFDPTRFRSGSGARSGAFLPFGLGPRACIGQALARATMARVLATILPRFRLIPREEAMPDAGGAYTLAPRKAALIQFLPRGRRAAG